MSKFKIKDLNGEKVGFNFDKDWSKEFKKKSYEDLVNENKEMLEMLQTLSNLMKEDIFLHDTSIKQWFSNTVIEVNELIKQATEI